MKMPRELEIVEKYQDGLFVGIGVKNYSPMFDNVAKEDADELLRRWNYWKDLLEAAELAVDSIAWFFDHPNAIKEADFQGSLHALEEAIAKAKPKS